MEKLVLLGFNLNVQHLFIWTSIRAAVLKWQYKVTLVQITDYDTLLKRSKCNSDNSIMDWNKSISMTVYTVNNF